MEEIILKYALQNAVKFGEANPKNIVGKVMGEVAEARTDPKATMKAIVDVCNDVNKMDKDKILEELQKLAPELLEKKVKEYDIFAFLRIEENKKINSAFPPGPEKYPHIGHAKALVINYELAKQHNGDFILRFEDTNPKLIKNEFYDIMLDNFKWLGIKWDKLIYASDHMQLYYDHAETLIKKGLAYMCSCKVEDIRENRAKKKECNCRNKSEDENIKEWNDFPKGNVLRLKIDLGHKNSTMRDPVIFRVIDEKHARVGSKYNIWPNYDFQNAIMDSFCDIDLRIRSKEFEMRSELQRWIQAQLKIKVTSTYEMARFNIKGVLSSGRVIREKVDSGELIGWDDPLLTTLVALRRRGFQPKAIWDFVLSTGINKSESTLTWDDLIMHNKRLLDKGANRYFFVKDPVEIIIKDAPEQEIKLYLHPEDPKRGERIFNTNDTFLITKEDMDNIKDDGLIRLMDCFNFKNLKFDSKDYKDFKGIGKKILHFLTKENNLDVEVMMPDKEIVKGKGEPSIKDIKIGDVIQFERFGFCRLDSIENNKYKFWFTH